jgi:hypothetical protein
MQLLRLILSLAYCAVALGVSVCVLVGRLPRRRQTTAYCTALFSRGLVRLAALIGVIHVAAFHTLLVDRVPWNWQAEDRFVYCLAAAVFLPMALAFGRVRQQAPAVLGVGVASFVIYGCAFLQVAAGA